MNYSSSTLNVKPLCLFFCYSACMPTHTNILIDLQLKISQVLYLQEKSITPLYFTTKVRFRSLCLAVQSVYKDIVSAHKRQKNPLFFDRKWPNMNKFETFLKKVGKSFGSFRKSTTFASLFEKARAFSSAGLEHLPYKQRVGGSNPSTPTWGVSL